MIADLSAHHVEGFVLNAGHTVQAVQSDYGYDLLLFTYGPDGYLEPDLVYLQLKAAESLATMRSTFVFDLDIRDYNLWMLDNLPVVLILFDARRKRAYWLAVQPYFREDETRRPKAGAKSVRVHVPARQAVNEPALGTIRGLKRQALAERRGGAR